MKEDSTKWDCTHLLPRLIELAAEQLEINGLDNEVLIGRGKDYQISETSVD